jgi:hypothetical protein
MSFRIQRNLSDVTGTATTRLSNPENGMYNGLVIGIFFVLTGLLVGFCRHWYLHYQIYKATSDPLSGKEATPTSHLIGVIFGKIESTLTTWGLINSKAEEETHLLSTTSVYDSTADHIVATKNLGIESPLEITVPPNRKPQYFRGVNCADGNDTMLMLAFTSVMAIGIFLNLHTTYGSRAVCITMVGDEIRWQAVKQNTSKVKRYKLHLSDVMSVEIGRQPGHLQVQEKDVGKWEGGSSKPINDTRDLDYDDLCFSLVTQKTSLYLEAASKLDRDSLIRGFQLRLESLRN